MWFVAAQSGDLDTLKICLFWGQQIDAMTADGRTALSLAAEHGHTAAVRLLLERKVNPNARGVGGVRPLTAAIENQHWDAAAALVCGGADPNGDGVASLVIAEPPKRQLLALMLKHGLDPHGAHEHWGPYIHFALNDAICADLFFGAGFDLRRWERETGESLLERALSCGASRLLHLLSLGADVDLPVDRRTGRTILMTIAAEEPHEQQDRLIRLLVKRGADLERRDDAGRTALDHARSAGNASAVRLFTRLRVERTRLHKAQAKAQAAAEAQAARAQRVAAKKRSAAPCAAGAKNPAPKPPKRAKRPAGQGNAPQRGNTAEHPTTPKSMPNAPAQRACRSTADHRQPADSAGR
ncbi:MAG TPA: ankyrin repeat domain-containing protein [Tepidisphaeraceae bacterium]|nr:ankyrin repeat domain-containing protein [Tepidisphaeraceae bacterium]